MAIKPVEQQYIGRPASARRTEHAIHIPTGTEGLGDSLTKLSGSVLNAYDAAGDLYAEQMNYTVADRVNKLKTATDEFQQKNIFTRIGGDAFNCMNLAEEQYAKDVDRLSEGLHGRYLADFKLRAAGIQTDFSKKVRQHELDETQKYGVRVHGVAVGQDVDAVIATADPSHSNLEHRYELFVAQHRYDPSQKAIEYDKYLENRQKGVVLNAEGKALRVVPDDQKGGEGTVTASEADAYGKSLKAGWDQWMAFNRSLNAKMAGGALQNLVNRRDLSGAEACLARIEKGDFGEIDPQVLLTMKASVAVVKKEASYGEKGESAANSALENALEEVSSNVYKKYTGVIELERVVKARSNAAHGSTAAGAVAEVQEQNPGLSGTEAWLEAKEQVKRNAQEDYDESKRKSVEGLKEGDDSKLLEGEAYAKARGLQAADAAKRYGSPEQDKYFVKAHDSLDSDPELKGNSPALEAAHAALKRKELRLKKEQAANLAADTEAYVRKIEEAGGDEVKISQIINATEGRLRTNLEAYKTKRSTASNNEDDKRCANFVSAVKEAKDKGGKVYLDPQTLRFVPEGAKKENELIVFDLTKSDEFELCIKCGGLTPAREAELRTWYQNKAANGLDPGEILAQFRSYLRSEFDADDDAILRFERLGGRVIRQVEQRWELYGKSSGNIKKEDFIKAEVARILNAEYAPGIRIKAVDSGPNLITYIFAQNQAKEASKLGRHIVDGRDLGKLTLTLDSVRQEYAEYEAACMALGKPVVSIEEYLRIVAGYAPGEESQSKEGYSLRSK